MNMMSQIILISSLILNSFLLIYLFGLIPFLLFISIVLNIGFISYVSYLLRERSDVQDDFFDLLSNLEIYSEKLLQTYELEMFYGDDTLEDLLRSSKVLVNKFYDYEDKYYQNAQENTEQGNEINDNTEDKT